MKQHFHYPEEINTVKKSLRNIFTRIALVYPNSYNVGMSSLGYKLLYAYFNAHDGVACERFFYDPSNSEQLPLRSIETGSPLKQFDIIAFSGQFELDYVNIIKALDISMIETRKIDRSEDDPVIISGGPAITANPLVMAPLFDASLRGDLEAAGAPLIDLIQQSSGDRGAVKEGLGDLEGWYTGSSGELPPVVRVEDLNSAFFPLDQVKPVYKDKTVKKKRTVFDGMMVEIVRGCNRNCSFCLIGHHQRPARRRKISLLKEIITRGLPANQTKKIMIIGSSTADYPHLKELLEWINREGYDFSLPSLRIDADKDILAELVKNRIQTLTVAPEVGSDNTRSMIGKKFTNRDVENFARRAKEESIRKLKLYFITGLTENPEEENRDIASLVRKITPLYRGNRLEITVSAFVPKKGTAMAGHDPDYGAIKKSYRVFKDLKKEVGISMYPARWAMIQKLLSTGDEEDYDLLEVVARTKASLMDWKRELAKTKGTYSW